LGKEGIEEGTSSAGAGARGGSSSSLVEQEESLLSGTVMGLSLGTGTIVGRRYLIYSPSKKASDLGFGEEGHI
jgi:hypothetical protein